MAQPKWTPRREKLFIDSLKTDGNVSRACERACMSRQAAYQHKRADLRFAALWEAAVQIGMEADLEMHEDEVTRRGLHGVDEPVFYRGEIVGETRKYSDTLLMFRAKILGRRLKRSEYNESQQFDSSSVDIKPYVDALAGAAQSVWTEHDTDCEENGREQ